MAKISDSKPLLLYANDIADLQDDMTRYGLRAEVVGTPFTIEGLRSKPYKNLDNIHDLSDQSKADIRSCLRDRNADAAWVYHFYHWGDHGDSSGENGELTLIPVRLSLMDGALGHPKETG